MISGLRAIWRRLRLGGSRQPLADHASRAGRTRRATIETIISRPWEFEVFRLDEQYYMSVLTGGVGQYFVTVRLTGQEVEAFRRNENEAVAASLDVLHRSRRFRRRYVEPSIDPF